MQGTRGSSYHEAMEMLTRATLGIRIPETAAAALAEVQADLRRRAGGEHARWFPTSDFVLTLAVLGELTVPQIARVQATVPDALHAFAAFPVSLRGVGGSPNATQPRVVWVGVDEGSDTLLGLHRTLDATLAPLGLPRESRPLMAHVPLGRLRSDSEQARSALGRTLRHASEDPLARFDVAEVWLWKSEVGPTGPTLSDVARWPLAP